MSATVHPQVAAADPAASVFLAANAGSGKTKTLIDRVARLLLAGVKPSAILCVTYTRAAAAEMQRRLFGQLGDWAVAKDGPLKESLAAIDETRRDLSNARALFAKALETPGGLQIQTIHAFCERLLRRFPLEAGISPGFRVLEEAEAARVSAEARADVARLALDRPDHRIGEAYAHFSVELDYRRFELMFADFEARRGKISAYLDRVGRSHMEADVWRRCGFERSTTPDEIIGAFLERVRQARWMRSAVGLLAADKASYRTLFAKLEAAARAEDFQAVRAALFTDKDKPRKVLTSPGLDAPTREWLDDQVRRVEAILAELRGARIAVETCHALVLAEAYAHVYEAAKARRGALDFGDLIERARDLLSVRADAAWVLYKLDGGIEHVLLDEGQDTAPEQWDLLRTLTAEFFAGTGGLGGDRTVFAVADEKQSIFSFQGAAPERFAEEEAAFGAMIGGAGRRFRREALRQSRRSRPEILAFVDTVFRDPADPAGLSPAARAPVPVSHEALRPAGGSIDLWPLEPGDPQEEQDPWAPVDAGQAHSAQRKLATRIAREIVAMVARGDAVGAKTDPEVRPCAFGDILVLVRRRNALFEEIIRALEREGAPVGGADRLKLSEHGLFQDLMALARFARYPPDDLSLAEVLRGPFTGVSEDDLYALAQARDGGLWTQLRNRADERPSLGSALGLLDWVRAAALQLAPFEFFNRLLSRLDGDGRSMRQRLLTRLGAEAKDALDAFLTAAAAAEGRATLDLETFVASMGATELEIKRDQDEGREGAVRIMTVHGAKGLEAPVVILPDTSTRATPQGGALLETEDGGFLWCPNKDSDCPQSSEARARRVCACEEESARLLYVALTRARDRLIVAGVAARSLTEGSWYDYVDRAFAALPTRSVSVQDIEARRFGSDPPPAPRSAEPTADLALLPTWLSRAAPSEPPLAPWRSPSNLAESAGGAAPSPLEAVAGLGRYRRGEIIHRLLQFLPDAPDRPGAAQRLLAVERDLSEDQRSEIATAALAILADPSFSEVFGAGSSAEVAIAGGAARLPKDLAVSGRIDRLLVTPDRVLAVDFKTNRPPPAHIEACDKVYITQMAVYAAVLEEVFPGRRIEAALLWTDGPRLMPVPENMIADALDALARIG